MKPFVCLFMLVAWGCLPLHAGEHLTITADMQFSYADERYGALDFTAAEVEFKRFIHFFPGDDRIREAEFKTGMSLLKLGRYREAAKRFDAIIRQGGEDPIVVESYFMQSQAFLEMGNTGYAQIVLRNFLKLTRDVDIRDRIHDRLALIQVRASTALGEDGRLDQAGASLERISPANTERLKTREKQAAVAAARTARQKDPVLAGALAVVPGGGFLYTERYKDAFVTFCLNAGLMFAAYEAFDSGNEALGGVIAFVETGFYTGNIYGSVSAAHKHNKKQQIEILDKAFRLDSRFDLRDDSFMFSLSHQF